MLQSSSGESEEVQTNVAAIYSHALLRIHVIGAMTFLIGVQIGIHDFCYELSNTTVGIP